VSYSQVYKSAGGFRLRRSEQTGFDRSFKVCTEQQDLMSHGSDFRCAEPRPKNCQNVSGASSVEFSTRSCWRQQPDVGRPQGPEPPVGDSYSINRRLALKVIQVTKNCVILYTIFHLLLLAVYRNNVSILHLFRATIIFTLYSK